MLWMCWRLRGWIDVMSYFCLDEYWFYIGWICIIVVYGIVFVRFLYLVGVFLWERNGWRMWFFKCFWVGSERLVVLLWGIKYLVDLWWWLDIYIWWVIGFLVSLCEGLMYLWEWVLCQIIDCEVEFGLLIFILE